MNPVIFNKIMNTFGPLEFVYIYIYAMAVREVKNTIEHETESKLPIIA